MAHPDRAEIRRKALLAASTVTLALALPGCAGLREPLKDDTATLADTEVTDTIARETGSDTDVVADTEVADTLVADSDVDVSGPKPDCTALGLDMVACCDTLRAWCDVNVPVDTDSTANEACVFGPGFDGSTGCIPWGPPVPPRASVA